VEAGPRPCCPRCERPIRVCVCALVPSIETTTRVLFVQHPREEDVAIGTARMASLCLPGSSLVVGVHVDDDPRVRAALADPDRPAILLWPGGDARDLASAPPRGPHTLIVVDGTWSLAKKVVRENPRLASLPRYALGAGAPSEYRIRREPREGCLSTIEAVARALGILEGEPQRFQPMMAPFRAMVDAQLEHQARLGGARSRVRLAARPKRPRPVPPELADLDRLLVVAAEANAWPHGHPRAHLPHELVHWVALRVGTGERFEALIAPEGPLSETTPHHARLDAALILGAPDAATFRERWRDFAASDDVLCGWGPYPVDVLRGRGGESARYLDLRAAVAGFIGGRAGSAEGACARFALDVAAPGRGRAGERLSQLAALARHLAAHRNDARGRGGELSSDRGGPAVGPPVDQ
jgi:DTW domain-containing protein YfiP